MRKRAKKGEKDFENTRTVKLICASGASERSKPKMALTQHKSERKRTVIITAKQWGQQVGKKRARKSMHKTSENKVQFLHPYKRPEKESKKWEKKRQKGSQIDVQYTLEG